MTASTASPVSSACLTAQCRAAFAAGDPSTPTTIRPVFSRGVLGHCSHPSSWPYGIGGSAQLPQERIPRLGRHDPDPGVGGQAALGLGDHRIQVKLSDLGQVIGQPGHAQQDVFQRGDVYRRSTPVPLEKGRSPNTANELVRIALPSAGSAGPRGRRARPSRRHRGRRQPAARTPALARRRPALPRRHGPSAEPVRRSAVAEGARELAIGGFDIGSAAQIQLHRPGLGLVHQPGRRCLQHDRSSQVGSRGHRLRLAAGENGADLRDLVAAQEVANGLGRKPASSRIAAQELGDDRSGVLAADPRQSGTQPCGRLSHSPYRVAWPSARAAPSG